MLIIHIAVLLLLRFVVAFLLLREHFWYYYYNQCLFRFILVPILLLVLSVPNTDVYAYRQ